MDDSWEGRSPVMADRPVGTRRALRPRLAMRRTDGAVAVTIGTVLMVVLIVVMVSVLGAFLLGLFDPDAPAPEIDVLTTGATDGMYVHVNYVSESRPLGEFRLLARTSGGDLVRFDSDGDAVADATVSFDLDDIVVASTTSTRDTPIVYVDLDGNGEVGPGDFLTFKNLFFPVTSPFIDTTHGYKRVGMAPSGVHRDSDMLVYVCPETLPGSNLMPGDVVRLTIGKGGTVYHTAEGEVTSNGIWSVMVKIPVTWSPAIYGETRITVRPGEVDEWFLDYPFKVLPENPVSKADRAYWDELNNPMSGGTSLVVVHRPSDEVVLELRV